MRNILNSHLDREAKRRSVRNERMAKATQRANKARERQMRKDFPELFADEGEE